MYRRPVVGEQILVYHIYYQERVSKKHTLLLLLLLTSYLFKIIDISLFTMQSLSPGAKMSLPLEYKFRDKKGKYTEMNGKRKLLIVT